MTASAWQLRRPPLPAPPTFASHSSGPACPAAVAARPTRTLNVTSHTAHTCVPDWGTWHVAGGPFAGHSVAVGMRWWQYTTAVVTLAASSKASRRIAPPPPPLPAAGLTPFARVEPPRDRPLLRGPGVVGVLLLAGALPAIPKGGECRSTTNSTLMVRTLTCSSRCR